MWTLRIGLGLAVLAGVLHARDKLRPSQALVVGVTASAIGVFAAGLIVGYIAGWVSA